MYYSNNNEQVANKALLYSVACDIVAAAISNIGKVAAADKVKTDTIVMESVSEAARNAAREAH